MSRYHDIATALAGADWSNVSIGNKAIILAAIDALGTAERLREELAYWEYIGRDKLDVELMRGLAAEAEARMTSQQSGET